MHPFPSLHHAKTSLVLLSALAGILFSAASLAASSLRLSLDPAASRVTFDVRVNIGIHSFTGEVESWTLDLTMPAGSDVPDHAVFTADVSALRTGKDGRDAKMLSWLKHSTHPTIRYEMKSIREAAAGLEADGELTIHGEMQPVTMPITITRDGRSLRVQGGVTINTRDFGLKIIRLAGFITVKPEVRIEFVATGTLE